jgi:histidine triad (HIT) family protein
MGELFNEDWGAKTKREYKKDCLFCSYSAKLPRFLISENDKAFSIVYGMQERGLCLSKAQVLVISKEHRENFSELTKDEWSACLLLIKDAIEKIGKTYHPIGFDIFSSLNKEGGQSHFHSHIHIIPKYKKDYGYCRRKWDLSLTFQDYKEIEEKLQTKQGVIKENDEAVAKLAPFGKQNGKAHIIIKPKKSIPNDIKQLGKEAWTEMWELMRESVKRCKENLGAKGFWWHTPLGQMTDVDQTSCPEFRIDIMPRWNVPTMEERHGGKTRSVPENERVAEKLRGNNNVYSFYSLIKREYNKKGPLKIIADWDDCLQLTKPMMIYNGANIDTSFNSFFEKYSKMVVCSPTPSSSQMEVQGDDSELAQKINEFEKKRKQLRGKGKQNPYKTKDFYDKTFFISIAEDLVKALKEGLIKKLVIITQYTGEKDDFVRNKESVFERTFKKFPQVEVSCTSVERISDPKKGMNEYKLFKPYRHEVIAEKWPDFDILVDDNPEILRECQAVFSSDKVYAAPNYKSLEKVPNCTFVTTKVSDLKISDFENISTKKWTSNKDVKSIWKQPYIYLAFGSGLLLAGLTFLIYHFLKNPKKK